MFSPKYMGVTSQKSKPLGIACKYLCANYQLIINSGFIIEPMTEQIDQFFRPDGTLISIPVKPILSSLPSTTQTQLHYAGT
jgi:hypothetical protein